MLGGIHFFFFCSTLDELWQRVVAVTHCQQVVT